jgi:hypothetical protein
LPNTNEALVMAIADIARCRRFAWGCVAETVALAMR